MIEILLSSYNGEKYLTEQIDSILNQTYKDWILTVRDDGSSDRSIEIITQYVSKYPEKIKLLRDDQDRLGSTLSFSKLINNSTANYIMLCDQDDVWLNHKIEVTFTKIIQWEKIKSIDTPLLIFTDLTVVNENLEVIANSFMKSQKLRPEVVNDVNKLLALNVVAGCTMMFNIASKPYIVPVPSKHIIHDQWIAVNISNYGRVIYINEPTILYRQHGNNVVGSNKINWKYFYGKLSKPSKQLQIYFDLIRHLKFKVSLIKFCYNKVKFTILRL